MLRKKSSTADTTDKPIMSTGKLKRKSRPGPSTMGFLVLIIQCLFIFVGLFLFISTRNPQKHDQHSNGDNIDAKFKSLENFQKDSPELFERMVEISNNKLRGKANFNDLDILSKPVENDKKSNFLESQVKKLQNQIKLISEREVLDKYGEGPYKVEFKLDFPHDDGADTFVVEMAPLSLMPHAVYHFLEMVRLELWNGSAFHRNAGHVVQAGPVSPYSGSRNTIAGNPRTGFQRNKLQSVAFQEYSSEYPHVKYTIGFAGRPGGPDWYVSTIDNTRNHGPGGQTSYAVKEEADPCFGRVIEGFDVIEKLGRQPVKEGSFRAMKENVGIIYAKLL